MLTKTEKYSVIWLDCISRNNTSMATKGLFSTKSGNLAGVSQCGTPVYCPFPTRPVTVAAVEELEPL